MSVFALKSVFYGRKIRGEANNILWAAILAIFQGKNSILITVRLVYYLPVIIFVLVNQCGVFLYSVWNSGGVRASNFMAVSG